MSSSLYIAALILVGEFAILAWGILFWMLKRQRNQEFDETTKAKAVIRQLDADEISHRDALTQLFEHTYHIEGDELTAKVDEYIGRERAFYNVMLNLYLKRDSSKLKQLPIELAKVIKPWSEMTPYGMMSADEVSGLEHEKDRLALELASTKETLERLMDEYTAAFKHGEQEHAPAAPVLSTPPAPAIQDTSNPVAAGAEQAIPADADLESFEAENSERSDIDAMLEALAQEEQQEVKSVPTQTSTPAPIKPNPPAARALSPEEIKDKHAQEELEGLADLFDYRSDIEPPSKAS
ncbi:hypothetical protein SAMN05421644_11012 [Allochromatium warmingii]|uniref:Uncharacterized protein n=1 Tax=Allochromatium warmingii TaxID=61595 RepID=A0A1H3DUY2_ALLWA|nr:hypothetical protein [Allochromatium warmingii]SDX69928.1 hypothetical protein SAMN05421644_11012 [Allochromatium warmingii]